MPEFKVLRGIPASGKSTEAMRWVMEDPANRVRVNRDQIREALTGSATNHTQEKLVTVKEMEFIERALRSGKDVVSDNTNTNTKFLPKLIKMAERAGATVTHQDFPISVNEAIRRNSLRERKVPEEVIRRMYGNLGPKGQFPVFPGSYQTKPVTPPSQRKLAMCFDMDGTLNDVRGVRHFLDGKYKDFDSFHRMSEFEPANEAVIQMAKDAHEAGYAVLITTARSEPYRETTQKWNDEHDVPYENIYMRADGDYRSDNEVKKDMFDEINKHYDIAACTDDNGQAIAAWESKGLKVYKIPFIDSAEDKRVITVNNPFQTGSCVRCGKQFKGEGSLGPTCRLR